MRNGGNIVRYTRQQLEEMVARGEDETDWAKVDSISDEELEEIVRNDPDDVYLTEAELADAALIYPVDLRKLRQRLGLSQESFAARFGFSVGTLRNWERGRRRPWGPAQVLLQVIDREPEAVERALGRKPTRAA
jgi:putative transcriptional regulator